MALISLILFKMKSDKIHPLFLNFIFRIYEYKTFFT